MNKSNSICFVFLTIFSSLFVFDNVVAQNLEVEHSPIKYEIKKIPVGQIELAYYIRGSGKPLVMINGYKGTLSSWDPALLEQLEKKYQLIIFDNRGIGLSTDTQENNTTISQMADDTAGLIKALGIKKAHVLGWSLGARIGQQLAIRHPEFVDRMILCAPNPGGSHQGLNSKNVQKKISSTNGEDEILTSLFTQTPEGVEAAKAYKSRVHAAEKAGEIPIDIESDKESLDRQNRARGELWDRFESNYNDLPNIKIPILLVNGIEDDINSPENIKIIAARIPSSWTAYFKGGHAFLFQDHERFGKLANIFLE